MSTAVIADSGIYACLRANSYLRTLAESELNELAAGCRLRKAQRGRPIWLSGAEVNFIGLVGRGFVRMVRPSPTGVETTLEIMGPGQIFGMLGVIAGCGCPLMAYGLTDTVYVEIPKAAFQTQYERSHAMKSVLMEKTAKRMHQKLDFMAKLSTGRAEVRIASILLMLAESYSQTSLEGALQLSVPLTRSSLGEMAGTTTETTIRTLSAWTQAGIIQTDNRFITIRKPAQLEAKLS